MTEEAEQDREGQPRRQDEHNVPARPPVREEYPGPQETTTGERIDPGSTKAVPTPSKSGIAGVRVLHDA